jgi:ribonuclease BN (tRNA processing enzyme)
VDLAAVEAVILSHLHIDHTAGRYGILGRRLQQRIPGELRIYGPPGTRQVVEQITVSQTYVDDLMKTDSAVGSLAPTTVTVTEVTEGSVVTAGDATVTATTNSHYGFHDGTAEAARFQSLGAVVLTHNPINASRIQQAGTTIAGLYPGPVAFAADLDTY